MNILRKETFEGYPEEYLLARVKSRRAVLLSRRQALGDGRMLPALAAENRWQGMLEEFAWLHRQMNPRQRKVFGPVFSMFELRTLILCLRLKKAEENQKIDRLLVPSLMAAELKDKLRESSDLPEAATAVTRFLGRFSTAFEGMGKTFATQGLLAFERELTGVFLEQALASSPNPLIREFFSRLADLRNLLTLYKQLRWETATSPQFIDRGGIPERKLREIWRRKDPAGLATLTGRFQGSPEVMATGSPEPILLRKITLELHRAAREPQSVGPVLEYMWRCYVEARNLGVILLGRELGREFLMGEVIQ